MLKIAVILGSTRPGRKGEAVARWVVEQARQRTDEAAAFVSYGIHGGVRAVEQLRLTLSAMRVAHVTAQVSLGMTTDFTNFTDFTPAGHQRQALTTTLDQLVAWSTALSTLRRTPAG